jgi:branched-chain amino acid transport system ATP-binding protein
MSAHINTSPGLVVEGVSLQRGGHTVVRDVSLHAPPGEVTALLGPNGAGKSSLALGIAGLLPLAGGHVSLNGIRISGLRAEKVRAAGLAVVPEGRKLLPSLTVEDNLGVATYMLAKSDRKSGVDYALSLFPELEKRWGSQARSLSGGEQQMVVLAQALVSRPKVLLIDELSLGLAPIVVKRLVPTLTEVAANGVGVLLIEQFAQLALSVANKAYIMEGEHIRYDGTAQELRDNPAMLSSAYLLKSH